MKHLIATSLAILVLASCAQEKEATEKKPAAETTAAELPKKLFIAPGPMSPKSLSEVRATAKVGDEVVFAGYVGGREEPFVDGRAVMLMADASKVPPCTDGCKTPWDACCEATEDIVANSATVQVVDESGAPLKASLMVPGTLDRGTSVTVFGKVREISDKLFVVDATSLALAKRQ
ncbi:hypothetical protein GC173_18390 [bacterium]|nr:hypothetical protein [bacterium]